MKKLMNFIKSKEKENKSISSEKKAAIRVKKTSSSTSQDKAKDKPNDLFWDDYSDIGYC